MQETDLPQSVRSVWKNLCMILPLAIVHSLVYRWLTIHSLYEPWLLQPTWIDEQIPFLIWTVWPYTLMVIVSIGGPLLIRCPIVFSRTFRAYILVIVIALSCYLLFPTRIDRPSVVMKSGLSWWLYSQFVSTLGEGACCPSGHIMFPMLACYAAWWEKRSWAPGLTAAMFLSSFSILTLKEHVVWDWFGGMLVVVFSAWMAKKMR